MRTLPALILLSIAAVMASCHVVEYRPQDPLTAEEIIELAAAGRTAEEIIQEIRDSGTIYRMQSEDVVELSNAGVPNEVIDYMLETGNRPPPRRYYYEPYPYYGYGYRHHYYPGYYSSWWCY